MEGRRGAALRGLRPALFVYVHDRAGGGARPLSPQARHAASDCALGRVAKQIQANPSQTKLNQAK